ncbi:Burnettramic acids biosynthesis cluster protein E [Paramyrothecium foliicola]|nr:Burnettramic acids biosynthesis cluster protein E [Paramyrothecium foliicola]
MPWNFNKGSSNKEEGSNCVLFEYQGLRPQRRPKSQHKGFVRAYAPVLEDCGIDQATWLEFLDGFEKSINKSSWFHLTNAGVFVASNASALTLGVSPALHLASTAVHVSVEASRRGYVNHQQNKYLDVMNEQFFMPRGLYCMVIKYAPSSDEVVEKVDLEHNITQSIGARQDQSKWQRLFSNSSMKIENDAGLPATAPLVFPGLTDASEETASNSFKQFGHVMQDYKDRRAAAKFEAENPNSRMPAAPRKEFASVYGDPNSAANSGGFISLASEGTKTSLGLSGGLHDKIRGRREARKDRRKQRKDKRPLSKLMKANALYLMVTNLPKQDGWNQY